MWKAVKETVKNVVKTAVEVIKIAAPYIGAAVGAATGYVVSGGDFAVALKFGKLGYQAGSYAKKLMNSCYTSDYRIRCDNSYFQDLAIQGASTYVG